MKATEELTHEHRVIELVLGALERMAREVEMGQPLVRDRAEKALEVLRNFADKCHHTKEEQHLFRALEARGMSRETGPLGVMLHEHELGRSHLRGMQRALVGAAEADPEAGPAFARHARAYTDLLRQHIQKEDQVLYPMAERMLSGEDDAELAAAFAQVEREVMGEGAHERYHRLAHELAARD